VTVDVSVLVPVLDEAENLRECVAAMQQQRFDGAVEFLFADGGSRDDTRAILAELAAGDPRIRVLENSRGHTPAGLNVCLRHARGAFVARMDAHALYPPAYLQLGVDRLRRGDASWVSGPQIPVARGPVSQAVVLAMGSRLGRGESRKWGGPGESGGEPPEFELDTGVFTGVWRRSDLLDHGGWDERWPINQDSELAARFFDRGERLVCLPAMAADWRPRDSYRGLARQYLRYGSYRAKTARRHPRSLRRSHLLAPALVVAIPVAAAGPRPARRLVRVPLALAVMHAGHGAGFLAGAARFGVPSAALLRVLGAGRLADRLALPADAVYAPSLHAAAAADRQPVSP
jgi:succinoglycan biosynthesis protein ExoA